MDNFPNSEKKNDLIEAINSKKINLVRKLLNDGVDVNCIDHTGMSPLQHACYKGELDIMRLLIENGANVNDQRHNHAYTALMFGALSGNTHVSFYSFCIKGSSLEKKYLRWLDSYCKKEQMQVW